MDNALESITALMRREARDRDVARRRALTRVVTERGMHPTWKIPVLYTAALVLTLVMVVAIYGGLWWVGSSIVQYSTQPNALQTLTSQISQSLSWLSVPTVVTIVLAAGSLIANEWLKRRHDRIERQRRTLSDWLEKLHARANASSSQLLLDDLDPYLTNRHVIELSLPRQDRYLAWWMSEMALEILRVTRKGPLVLPATNDRNEDAKYVFDEIGESISAWHYRKLSTSDFFVPYTIRRRARMAGTDVDSFATALGLQDFTVPQPFTKSKQERFIGVLRRRPEVLEALDAGMLRGTVFDLQTEAYVDRLGRILRLRFLRGRLWVIRQDFQSISFIASLLKTMGTVVPPAEVVLPDSKGKSGPVLGGGTT